LSIFKSGIQITKRGFLIGAILFFAFFTLYLLFSFYLTQYIVSSADELPIIQALVHFVIAATILLSSFLIQRFNKLHLVYAGSTAMAIATVLLFFTSIEVVGLIIIFVMAIFFSIGVLGLFTYFWQITSSEERGRVAGLTGFVFLPFYYFTVQIVAGTLDFPATVLLIMLISVGALVVIFLRPEKIALTAIKKERARYFEKRTIVFYSVPWILFSLVNAILAKNTSITVVQQVSSSFYLLLIGVQVIGVIFGAIIGGVVADFFGRRFALAFSLTLYGTSSALVGLFQNNALFSIVYVINGLSWGFLLILYTFVIWGDLATEKNCAKMYAIGLAIYYSAFGFGLLSDQISQIPLVVTALLSCLLIFFSNVPIILAPELLPSDFREKMKLKMHIKLLKKLYKRSKNHG